MRGDWAPAKVGHRAMRRFLGQTALVVGGTGGALFAAGAVYFRSRNASPIQHTEFPEAAGKTFIVTGGTSGIGEKRGERRERVEKKPLRRVKLVPSMTCYKRDTFSSPCRQGRREATCALWRTRHRRRPQRRTKGSAGR
jgi:hypothetical protein